MTDLTSELKRYFDVAMFDRLEAYTVLPDGRSFERSDEDEHAIDVFENLHDSVDLIPSSLVEELSRLRTTAPERFDEELHRTLGKVGLKFSPASATEFVDRLKRTLSSVRSQGSTGRDT